ncbi:cadherin-related family member 5 isoform X3 [Xiphophorus couchianus]|uniref:cadherin-related family member 5 isoform X3 n=1 Tax=Xiphophorus couchianus TaxID=32473 RepID=UPI0010171FCE|nr:cadherin-related family member 5-like isoform X3 [Xiphophorus couchianus]
MSWMFCLLLWQLVLRVSCHVATGKNIYYIVSHGCCFSTSTAGSVWSLASLCTAGSNIFASVRENSPVGQFISHISIRSDPRANTVRLCLTGPNANWFYLEGRTIRLNSSASRVLDREVLGPFLIAELTCYEDDIKQSHYRILVEILNENDNKPKFLEETIQPFIISEVAAVNSVVFTVKAVDSDGDMISYIIDQSSEDAWFFRIDLPNSGKVVLSKPLDYESRTRLQIIMWAQESNTEEKFNISTVLTINIEDVDDQYPHFLPCTPVSPGVPICMNPIYTANITQKHQDSVLEFSPGPIRARDGDRGINAPLMYTILSGDNHDRFVMDNRTGEIRLTRAVDERQPGANFTLIVMVVARDEESGEEASASVDIEVLQRGQAVPHGAFTEQQLFGDVDSRLAGGIAALILLTFLSAFLFLLLRFVRRRRPQEADVLPATTTLQHHKVSSRSPGFMDEALRRQASLRSGSFHGRQGLYIRRQSLPPPTSSSSAADSRSRPQSPSSEVSLSDPAGRCRFQTDMFVVVEKPAGVASGWARSPDVTAGLQVHAGMPQSDEDINIDQSKEDT